MNTPKDFLGFPGNSIFSRSTFRANEHETVLQNIMVILSRTGNSFRRLTWDEYKEQRLRDGNFTESEQAYFVAVRTYTEDEEMARSVSPAWGKG